MDFDLSEEQLQIKYSVREFAEAEIGPHVMEWDEAQHFPKDLWPKLGEMGLLGVIIPEEHGGAGMGYVEYANVIEEISRVDGSIGLSLAAHNSLCTNHLYKAGNDEQREKYVAPLARGEESQHLTKGTRMPRGREFHVRAQVVDDADENCQRRVCSRASDF